jgi:hypothetical protein
MARALATASRSLALDAGAARAHATDIEIATDIDTEASVDLTVGQGPPYAAHKPRGSGQAELAKFSPVQRGPPPLAQSSMRAATPPAIVLP